MGKLNLVQLAHVLAASTLCIAHDSGPFHLSLALGARAVAIFGPTSTTRLGPFRTNLGLAVHASLPCLPCHKSECLVQLPGRNERDRPYCMTDLRPADVLAKAHSFLKAPAPAG
jgi:ADP-heptose:LPS heptosyltransferase